MMREQTTPVVPASAAPMSAAREWWCRLRAKLGKAIAVLAPTLQQGDFTRFDEAEVAARYRSRPHPPEALDEQTWSDLEVWSLHQQLGGAASIVGQQALYDTLRQVATPAQVTRQREQLAWLHAAASQVAPLRAALAALRAIPFGLTQLLQGTGVADGDRKVRLIGMFQVVMLLAWMGPLVAISLLAPLCAIVFLGLVLHLGWISRHAGAEARIAALRQLLSTALAVAELPGIPLHQAAALAALRDRIVAVRRALTRPVLETAMPLTKLYTDWFFLSGMRHALKVDGVVRAHRDLLAEVFDHLGALDMQVTLAEYTRQRDICWVTRTNRALRLSDGYNPLFEQCVPVSFDTAGSVFLTGQNGAGKSTLLRILGLNLVCGRAFGWCFAHQAALPTGRLITSINVEDSWRDGQSLYVAELARARMMMAAARDTPGCVCLIDEIFRGTNHLESVSVATAVLHELTGSCLTIVSSHNLVLVPLLRDTATPMVLGRRGGQVTVTGGVLAATNGIDILEQHQFPPHVVANARTVSSWLGPYLSSPATRPVLDAAPPASGA